MKEVVAIARMVPMGIDFWASRKSPDRFEPAMIPGRGVTTKKKSNMKSLEINEKLTLTQIIPTL